MAARDIFTTSGTWTCPAGVTAVSVEAWGGGGSGGCSNNIGSDGSSGGGGSAYSKLNTLAVTPGNVYTVTVGTGGLGVTSISAPGNAGGDSWFSTSGTILAKGGSAGLQGPGTGLGAASGGQSSFGIGDVKFSGGNSGSTNGTVGSGGGSSAGTASNGNNGGFNNNPPQGLGGSAPTGGFAGGNSSSGGNQSAASGSAPGAGGGNSYQNTSAHTSGAGANGQVQLSYTLNTTFTGSEFSHSGDAIGSQTSYANVLLAEFTHAVDSLLKILPFRPTFWSLEARAGAGKPTTIWTVINSSM